MARKSIIALAKLIRSNPNSFEVEPLGKDIVLRDKETDIVFFTSVSQDVYPILHSEEPSKDGGFLVLTPDENTELITAMREANLFDGPENDLSNDTENEIDSIIFTKLTESRNVATSLR